MASPNYRVIIFESPSAHDLLRNDCEGRILRECLQLQKIPSEYYLTVSKETFGHALIETCVGTIPKLDNDTHLIIHISAHANSDGFELTDNSSFDWPAFVKVLEIVNSEINGRLVVCLSCCEGSGALPTAFVQQKPFAAFISCQGKPTWNETSIAFAAFYHLLQAGKTMQDAYNGMKAASGHDSFALLEGKLLTSFREKLNTLLTKMSPEEIIEKIHIAVGESAKGKK